MENSYASEQPGFYQFRNRLGAKTYIRKWDGVNWYIGHMYRCLVESNALLTAGNVDSLIRNGQSYELIADLEGKPLSTTFRSVQLDLFD